MIIDVFTQSIILFTQDADCNYKVALATDFLDLQDVAGVNVALVEASDYLALSDRVDLVKTISVSVSDTLVLTQSSQPRVIDVTAESHLVLIQEADHERLWPAVFHTLTLVDEAVAVLALGTYDTLELLSVATYNITKNVVAESQLALNSMGGGYKLDKMWIADSTLTVDAP